jgi:hypothetical protein
VLITSCVLTNRCQHTVHFVTPNTDGDEEELDYDVSVEVDDNVEARKIIDEPSETAEAQQQHLEQSYHHSIRVSDGLLPTDFDPSTIENVSITAFDNTSDLPSIHDVLSSHISPTLTAPQSDHNNPVHLRRTASASEIFQSATISGWHASPTSNPRSSPHATKKSPLESIHNLSPFANSTFSPNSSLNLRWPVSNAYEASLLHHYLVYCTNWIDVCDSRHHFEKEVPKRAARFPVIINGILGLSARHLWLMGKAEEDHSQPYVDQCLQALIVALEDPLAHWDENFLVAVILLRLHEEMGDADEQCHHFGKLGSCLRYRIISPSRVSRCPLTLQRSSPGFRKSYYSSIFWLTEGLQVPPASSTVFPPSLPTAASANPLHGSLSANTYMSA